MKIISQMLEEITKLVKHLLGKASRDVKMFCLGALFTILVMSYGLITVISVASLIVDMLTT